MFDEASVKMKSISSNSRVSNEEKGRALVPASNSLVVSGRPAGVSADFESSKSSTVSSASEKKMGELPKENSALVVQESSEKRKWVKKVSLSIGGYKTSFQFSDPMANLAQSVNEALDVVSDASLVQEAKALDDIGEKIEEERDYDENPTKLFMYLQQRAWGLALTQLKKNPEEAKVWVFRKQNSHKTPNVTDGYKSQALVVQSQALVVHGGDSNKLRWKLLPLHASIVLGAPPEIIMEIIKAYPNAARKPDERGSLPVHLAASRLDVDPEGEKVVLQLFGAFPDSIEIQDRKGRTPPELAKLARMRKDVEEKRRQSALIQEELGVEKTASSIRDGEIDEDSAEDDGIRVSGSNADDDSSIKSSKSGRFRMLIQKAKSTDTIDKRRKKKKSSKSNSMLLRAKSVDFEESFKIEDGSSDEIGPGFAILKPSKSYEQRVKSEMENDDEDNVAISMYYETPNIAPGSTEYARSIPLPMSFCEDDKAATAADVPEAEASNSKEAEQPNESLRVLLETAAENAGRVGEDVTEYLKILEDEWVTDVEALRRLDGDTLDSLLPILLSREVQRLINHADSIDNKFLIEDKDNDGKWVRDSRERGRSPHKKKTKKRVARRSKKSAEPRRLRPDSPQEGPLNTITEECSDNDDEVSIMTEARTVYSRASTRVRIDEKPAEMKAERKDQEVDDAPSEFDSDLQIRKVHATLISEARKKFPTRESLEDAIRTRQAEVEAAVNSGFDVDKQTLARAALADDEVRKLLPLRLILPTVTDLKEMIGVLQVHKENALRNLNLNKAVGIQTEIDELQAQIEEEERYVMRKRMSGTECISCGEVFTQEKKMVGILKTKKEQHCAKCKVSLKSVGSDERSVGSAGSEKSAKRAVVVESEAVFDKKDG